MQRRSTFLAGIASTLLSLPAVAGAQSVAPPIRVGAVGVEDYALAYYAQQQGYLKRAGLSADLAMFAGGGAASTALYADALDITGTNVGSMASAHLRGLPVRLLCGGSLYSSSAPHVFLVTAKDSPIRYAKDLVGKKIAVTSIGDLMQAAIMLWLDKNGGDSSQASFLELNTTQMAPAVIAHRVDTAILVEPFYTQSKGDVSLIATPYDALGKQFLISGWIANDNWLKANTAAAGRFATAMRSAADWANSNPKDAQTLLAAYTKLDPAVIAATHHVRQASSLDASMIQPVIDVLIRYKMLARSFPASELFALGGRR
jgi:NitT/TauT family transport system substrate-binding protein